MSADSFSAGFENSVLEEEPGVFEVEKSEDAGVLVDAKLNSPGFGADELAAGVVEELLDAGIAPNILPLPCPAGVKLNAGFSDDIV